MSKARQDNQLLLHMVALLFSLAEMALLANCLPFAQRLVLFAVMRQGDAAARKIAIRAGSSSAFICPSESDAPDAALRLAIGFRMLAVALQAIALRQQNLLTFGDHSDRPRPDDQTSITTVEKATNRPAASFDRPFARAGPLH